VNDHTYVAHSHGSETLKRTKQTVMNQIGQTRLQPTDHTNNATESAVQINRA